MDDSIMKKLQRPMKNIHFRPKTCYNGKVLLLAYLDSRDVMNRLDEVVGFQNWQRDYKQIKNNLFCGVGLFHQGEWIWKWDCGTESEMDKEKGEASDSFKRAAVSWGIGRYLYYLPTFKVDIQKTGTNYISIKDKATNQQLKGYYNIPTMPRWAIYKEDK
jgi:hypothetical protein